MIASTDNESWLIDCGDEIIQKKAGSGFSGLSDWERLVYCLWVADYSIRNAGDLGAAEDLYEDYRKDLLFFSRELELTKTSEVFASATEFAPEQYERRFEDICREVRKAEPNV
ncbi:hypothetical protein KF946_10100 [Idiomarina loihiensis]|uniref:hypothetical protein n=1 Tax=Idiomarina loihiensis TaxID=135577 RepID=UPI00129D0202|nr:hypothetical protein [Idiomarina loihiensis]MRJ44614.1 hypothetical protein [Idiomarina loihiensis]UTW32360.1 hypothetical protein KF946_10100 [Idiomarina loihiensis]